MPTRPRNRVLRDGLTPAQILLLGRHRRGLVRLAGVLAARLGRNLTDVMFVVAHEASNVARTVSEQLGGGLVTGNEAVVVPGLATELGAWLKRLALAGPVYDWTGADDGVPVIVIDQGDEMTLVRLTHLSAASFEAQNRSIILLE